MNGYQEISSRMNAQSRSKPPAANKQTRSSCQSSAGEGLEYIPSAWVIHTSTLFGDFAPIHMEALSSIRPKTEISESMVKERVSEGQALTACCLH